MPMCPFLVLIPSGNRTQDVDPGQSCVKDRPELSGIRTPAAGQVFRDDTQSHSGCTSCIQDAVLPIKLRPQCNRGRRHSLKRPLDYESTLARRSTSRVDLCQFAATFDGLSRRLYADEGCGTSISLALRSGNGPSSQTQPACPTNAWLKRSA